MTDKLLSIQEVCSLLNVSETTVKRYAREHLLKTKKEGNELRFPEADVLKYKQINERLNR